MALYRITHFSLVLSLGVCLFINTAGAQPVSQDKSPVTQPVSEPASPTPPLSTSSSTTPAAHAHASSKHVKHHAKHTTKHKTKKHKHHATAKKKHVAKAVKKTTALEPKHETQPQPLAAAPVKSTDVPAPQNIRSAVPEKQAVAEPPAIDPPKMSTSKTAVSKSVAYSFCVGYDNCVPTRYEITGKQTRFLQQNPEGHWIEAKANPVMAADLMKLASSEQSSVVVRSLTSTEKANIADHQGRIHAQLIGALMAGGERKSEAKEIMRQISIHNVSDLEAYDPKLGTNPSAREVASELSSERYSQSGG